MKTIAVILIVFQIATIVMFVTFLLYGSYIGGSAILGGYEDAGRYFVEYKGDYTEVSAGEYNVSCTIEAITFIIYPVGFICGCVYTAYFRDVLKPKDK